MNVLNSIFNTALAVFETLLSNFSTNPFVHVIGVITIGLVVFGFIFFVLHKT